MVKACTGKILRIDLSTEETKEEETSLDFMKTHLGSLGLAAKVMLEEVEPEVSPLNPENRLIIAAGLLVGTPVPCGNKSIVIARSPLTGIWGDSVFSATFGIELKRCGYDMLIAKGKADSPRYLWIQNGNIEFRDANHLWGQHTFDVYETIKKEIEDPRAGVIGIGPAGEEMVSLAGLISDEGRAAGRAGLGAVMGSKNLKALAARGTDKLELEDRDEFMRIRSEALKNISDSPGTRSMRSYGTAGGVVAHEEAGNLPIRNWTRGKLPRVEEISGNYMAEIGVLISNKACYGCPIACGRYVEVKEDPYKMKGYGPEYETLAGLGSYCWNTDLASISKANDICNRYGIDTISTGSVIAFAMECYENGLITKEDTEGIDLAWGNSEAVVEMAELIGKKEGFGAILGRGVKAAAEKIGKDAERFAIHVKGLELPAHNPYKYKSMGLNYATGNRGACHNRGSPSYPARGMLSPEVGIKQKLDPLTIEGKAKVTKIHQDLCTAVDALGVCKFAIFFCGMSLSQVEDMFNAATGWNLTWDDLLQAGERIWYLERAFNIRMGVTRKDDSLPERFLKEAVPDGAVKGETVNLKPMLKEYYELRGFDETGRPKTEKLRNLDLDYVVPLLYGGT
ncbi:MAG: aldehyde ferredoxin oxidoreductase [Nitrososphaeria archaeon]|nr:aldehyde ferredoxin oxidoreductase [Nitrososphaeria archaeon]NIN52627.1 aldehyde ferredoxin oxidoreductase [Nitrososphaeria archaeon]NIQ33102.1 aldehyde ferredoxin oxidoreductase [Nitrososphaeria archaeon]